MKTPIYLLLILFTLGCENAIKKVPPTNSPKPVLSRVNVFLGTSGDHGQMSPSASHPFSMLSIGPQTSPCNHTGYEYEAKKYLGFTHTRVEGVGCTGSGGNILIKPILNGDIHTPLMKQKQHAEPAYYRANFKNGIQAEMTVSHNLGMHHYRFPHQNNGLFIDLSFTHPERFVNAEHQMETNAISGWIDTKTTCDKGIYRIYFHLQIPDAKKITRINKHQFQVKGNGTSELMLQIAFSSLSVEYAKNKISNESFEQIKTITQKQWADLLNRIKVSGEKERVDLFYSLLYRGLQAPYLISEPNGIYRAIDGSIQYNTYPVYNGWAIWDNYREQLPMLSLFYPNYFNPIAKSIANLYPYGKKQWASMHEPSPTVRTEHAVVVLLDAYQKGYDIPLQKIKSQLIQEVEQLPYDTPDQALESSYDCWALAQILEITGDHLLSKQFLNKALDYKKYWLKDFADHSVEDVDEMQARGMYQGTIWQYRWLVPFDIKGLKQLIGEEEEYIRQLDQFFEGYNYNHANQVDLQVPGMYNASKKAWKSQRLYQKLLLDSVVHCYFNNNSKGIDPYIGRIYQNQPKAYLRTMDDDAGTMSSWFVMRSLGLSPANVGDPIYYLTTPVFQSVQVDWENGKQLTILISNYNKDHYYIQKASLNGKELSRNWLSHEELISGGELIIETAEKPNKDWGITNQWISEIKQ